MMIGLLVLIGSIAISGFFVWRWDLVSGPSGASGSQIIAIFLPVAATILGGSMTFAAATIGLSIQRQAERRLELDSMIQASSLLSTDASKSQRAAALMALVELGQLELAVEILTPMWERDEIDVTSAVWIIDRALQRGDEATQISATSALWAQSAKLGSPDGVFFLPMSIYTGRVETIAPLAVQQLIAAVTTTMTHGSFQQNANTAGFFLEYFEPHVSEPWTRSFYDMIKESIDIGISRSFDKLPELWLRWDKQVDARRPGEYLSNALAALNEILDPWIRAHQTETATQTQERER